jgi:hypothetical protein
MTAVLLHLCLDGGKQRGVDQGRDGDGKPLGDRHIIVGSRATRLLWTAPLGPQAWTEGALTRFPKRRGALIGGIVQDAPDHTPLPHRTPGARALACPRETATHLANGHTVPAYPVEDLADDAGFVREHLIAGLAPAGMLINIAVAIGGPRQHIDEAGPCRMQLAPPMPFDNLGPLIFGHHALHLAQQIILRAAP